MAKLSKSKLKIIVKECLVEILEEGLSISSYAGQLSESSSRTKARPLALRGESTSKRDRASGRRDVADKIVYGQDDDDAIESQKFEKSIKSAVTSVTDDPIMSSIFSDTARTTLQEQYHSELKKGPSVMMQGDKAAKAASQSDPAELFGAASQNWASLAFSDKKIK